MRTIHKVLYGVLGMCALMVSNSVLAQEKSTPEKKEATTNSQAQTASTKSHAILFKIHDITPVQNAEGLTSSCDFLVTFYNRTPDGMRFGKLDLGWVDNISDRYKIDEEKTNEQESTERSFNLVSRGNGNIEGSVKANIDMPPLGAYQQVSVKGHIKTEKCFLLLEPLQFKVTSCAIAEQNDQSSKQATRSASPRSAGECAGLFQFVDSQNPEYYDEFKEISYSEQEASLNREKQTNLDEINTKYNKIVNTFEQANSILRNIQ